MIKIEYKCDNCGACEPYMPSKAGGIIVCMKCSHTERIIIPTKGERKKTVQTPTNLPTKDRDELRAMTDQLLRDLRNDR